MYVRNIRSYLSCIDYDIRLVGRTYNGRIRKTDSSTTLVVVIEHGLGEKYLVIAMSFVLEHALKWFGYGVTLKVLQQSLNETDFINHGCLVMILLVVRSQWIMSSAINRAYLKDVVKV